MRPYSLDLRERVAAAVDAGEMSQRAIARTFRVSLSFVSRLVKRRREAKTLSPAAHGGGPSSVLSDEDRVKLGRLVAERNDDTLAELRDRGGFRCSLTTIWRALRRMGLTRKKKSRHADERDRPDVKRKRRSFRGEMKRIKPSRLHFVDETGVTTAMARDYARAPRGERAVGTAPGKWESFTMVAALGVDGAHAPLVLPGAIDAEAFDSYVEQVLAPALHPGDVVAWDDLASHQGRDAARVVRKARARLVWLPPYSPDYNPIEQLWSKLKSHLRRAAARSKDAVYTVLGEALDEVTFRDVIHWFKHAGLCATHG